jgi:DUF1680 family protein
MLSHDDGIAATAYGPCEMHAVVRNTPVHIAEETAYPFRETVRLTVNPATPLTFPLLLRIPAWATGAEIQINGLDQAPPAPGSFARIERTWKSGDYVTIKFPMKPRISEGFQDSVTIERGSLVFSYGIGESWLKLRDHGMSSDWQIYPTTQWNYALAVDPAASSNNISTTEEEMGSCPFSAKSAPVKLHVQGRKIPTWRAEDGVATPVPQSPVTSDQPEEEITLIPYAAAKLRITAFPRVAATRNS